MNTQLDRSKEVPHSNKLVKKLFNTAKHMAEHGGAVWVMADKVSIAGCQWCGDSWHTFSTNLELRKTLRSAGLAPVDKERLCWKPRLSK